MIVCNKKVLMVLLLGIFLVSCSQNNENIEESVDHSRKEETEETAAVASEPSIEETAVTFDDTSTEETTPETTDEETPLTTFPYFQITHNNSSYVCVEGFEPPALEFYFHQPMPDFLTDEQKVLYCCAQTLYPILRGSTIFIDDFPKERRYTIHTWLQSGIVHPMAWCGSTLFRLDRTVRTVGRFCRNGTVGFHR